MSFISRIALGTAQFGMNYGVANKSGLVNSSQITHIIHRAAEAGINTLDTAIAYGNAERRLGRVGIQGWRVVTKLPPIPEGETPNLWVRSLVEDSLLRLGIDSLYGLLLHKPENLLGKHGDAIFNALTDIKKEGLVKKIGISAYDPAEIYNALNKFPLDIVQAPLNIIDQRVINSGCLEYMFRQGIEFHARSIFLQGLLLMDANARPLHFNRWSALWHAWNEWLNENNLTPLAACLGFVGADDRVARLIVGVDNHGHLNEILESTTNMINFSIADRISCDDRLLINPSMWSSL